MTVLYVPAPGTGVAANVAVSNFPAEQGSNLNQVGGAAVALGASVRAAAIPITRATDDPALPALVNDQTLDCLLYVRYALPGNGAYSLTDAVTAWGAAFPSTFRTVVVQCETNSARVTDDGITSPTPGTNGAPLQVGGMYAWTPLTSSKMLFSNAVASATAVLHIYFYK